MKTSQGPSDGLALRLVKTLDETMLAVARRFILELNALRGFLCHRSPPWCPCFWSGSADVRRGKRTAINGEAASGTLDEGLGLAVCGKRDVEKDIAVRGTSII